MVFKRSRTLKGGTKQIETVPDLDHALVLVLVPDLCHVHQDIVL